MFLLNSCLDLLPAARLRGRPFSLSYGAILPSSLAVLLPPASGSSPFLPVSVYGTGPGGTIAAFLGGAQELFPTLSSVPPGGHICAALAPRLRPSRGPGTMPGMLRLRRVPAVLAAGGAGFSTSCPSPTRFRLGLGPGFPREDQLYPGNLRYPAARIPTALSLLIPAFSLRAPPPPLAGAASPARRCSPTDALPHPMASASCFSPVHFRRGTSRPVSCYALFQCMAASEPTSWLSSKSHILCHLTRPSGPWPMVWAFPLSAA